ncbi:MAG: biotin--[acetyl-CoA-carboxylase] ligase, partial [Bacteroidota bacterium]|nr:biotin--[acetyl-CoA-carboxylase] ligase [Bacteroidota bacterium]
HAQNFGQTVYAFEVIDSTNLFAKSLSAKEAPHGTLIIAEQQTAGKGRLGRRWQSEKGANLLFSLILHPTFQFEKTKLLPFAAGLAVADAIERYTGLKTECKWPNDVLIEKKKVAGILMETATQDTITKEIILGIGVNVNQQFFPPELASTATSIFLQTGKTIDRTTLLQVLLEELEHRYDQLAQFPSSLIIEDWKRRATMMNSTVFLLEGSIQKAVTALDVTPEGALVIRAADGTRRELYAGDVSLRFNS